MMNSSSTRGAWPPLQNYNDCCHYAKLGFQVRVVSRIEKAAAQQAASE